MIATCVTVDCVNYGADIPIPQFLAPDGTVEQLITPPAYCGNCGELMIEVEEGES